MTKFKAETCDAIIKSMRAGAFLETAAARAGVTPKQVRVWLYKAANGDPEYQEFARRYREAEATGEELHLGIINRAAANGAWQGAAWVLERRHRDRWGAQIRVTIEEEIDALVRRLETKLSPEELERVLAALEDEDAGPGDT